jgi:hypothetical protein
MLPIPKETHQIWLPTRFRFGTSLFLLYINDLETNIECIAIRAMTQVPKTTSCKHIFKSLCILPLPSLYIYKMLIYIKSNLNNFATNSGLHSYKKKIKDNLHIVPCNTSLCKNNFNNVGLQLLNHLALYIKEISILHKFKNALKTYLLDHCFHKVDEFLLCETKH